MAEAARLIEKYNVDGASDLSKAAEIHQTILSFKPDWRTYEATTGCSQDLPLSADVSAFKGKIQGNTSVVQACMKALSTKEEKPVQWLLTLLYDMLREDSSCYNMFEEAAKKQIQVYKPLMDLLQKPALDTYSADKAAWLLSAIISHVPLAFSDAEVKNFVSMLLGANSNSDLGVLEAITNLLKSGSFRGLVWSQPGVGERIFRISKNSPSPYLYKCVFAIWTLSFDPEITQALKESKEYQVVQKIREILTYCRVEKVIRLCLTVLTNFLGVKSLCEDIVEAGILEAVQSLEYEKWRDAELYDDIKNMATQISSEVNEMSNFERYERELQSSKLQWGFIHSSKFWAENVMKFESNDFRALKTLALLLNDPKSDTTTLAVACHDIGEFVALHPLGKQKVAKLQVKEKVMELMGSTDPDFRDVRREALLCCQKIMLNKWQEIETAK
eukprot:TRINITY_DN1652_c0_g1_i3.p1 TRINITY_DN1652_c0_g1~~TRINITY_DN1652_c0_g1_i3.p1  ORF type:complete len:444 (+),score=98.63 TRINITY_DN1652_c0_g1_i3:58-1389(+)